MTRSVPRLHLIGPLGQVTDPARYGDIALASASAGAGAIHVRLPGASGGNVYSLTSTILSSVSGQTGAMVIVNDRVDVAAIAGADGVHLGERSLSVSQARELLPEPSLVGRSVHDVAGARLATEDGADYLIAGHIFDTGSKEDIPGRGTAWLREVCEATRLPVVAIGGITAGRVQEVMSCGAWGVAVGREILEAADPAEATAILAAEVQQGKAG